MPEPVLPDRDTRERLLDVLAELVARGGASRLLAPPVVPGSSAFPEPWAPSRAGVTLLLRRLLWHAGIARDIAIEDRRAGAAPPTERKPATTVELLDVSAHEARFLLGFIGADDVAGTLAHEIGVVHAVLTPHTSGRGSPYRQAEVPVVAVDPDVDLERGSIATVYLGLGVLATNAAFQQYSRPGRFNGGYVPLEYDVLRAGYVPMSALAYLLAVQAIVSAESGEPVLPPPGLLPPQRDEVIAWIDALGGSSARARLRERLGIAASSTRESREIPEPFVDADEAELDEAPERIAFRWHTNRGGLGMLAGAVLGMGIAIVASRGLAPLMAIGSAASGHAIGRRMKRPRCSGCATIVDAAAVTCPHCGAALRGDIADLSERLEAEEKLEAGATRGSRV